MPQARPAGLVRLREKCGAIRWQSVTPQVTVCLAERARRRGATAPTGA